MASVPPSIQEIKTAPRSRPRYMLPPTPRHACRPAPCKTPQRTTLLTLRQGKSYRGKNVHYIKRIMYRSVRTIKGKSPTPSFGVLASRASLRAHATTSVHELRRCFQMATCIVAIALQAVLRHVVLHVACAQRPILGPDRWRWNVEVADAVVWKYTRRCRVSWGAFR
jgi:hypothetical protein